MIWDPVRFPDLKGMAKSIHDLNMKLMVSIWPSVGSDTSWGKELSLTNKSDLSPKREM